MEQKAEEIIDDYLKDMAIDEVVERTLRAKKRYEKHEIESERDTRLRNTTLLLENYRLLKHHCDNVLALEDSPKFFMGERLEIESLMKYRRKTKVMIEYVEKMLDIYMAHCASEGEVAERKAKILKKLYIDEPSMNMEQVARFYNVEVPRISKQKKKAIKEFTILLFGAVAIEDMEEMIR